MQKNRTFKKFKDSFLRWGTVGIFFQQEGRFEIKYIFGLRRLLKKITKKKSKRRRRIWEHPKSIWFVLFPNFILSTKSKNSRMGKGKGSLIRWTIRVRGGLMLFEFKGFTFKKLTLFKNRIQKKLQLKIALTHILFFYQPTAVYNTRLLIPRKFSM